MTVTKLLAARGARTHRRAWAAVFAALTLTSLLLGAFALAIASVGLGHARSERYAGADLVVAGDQGTRYTAKPWGGDPETAHTGLTERVRVPRQALSVVRNVPGVAAAVADDVFQAGVEARGAGRARAATGRPWTAAALAPYRLREGREPRRADEVVVGAGADEFEVGGPQDGAHPADRLTVRVNGTPTTYTVVGIARAPSNELYFTVARAAALAGSPGSTAALGVRLEEGTRSGEVAARVRRALDRADVRSVGERAAGDPAPLRVLTGDDKGDAEFLDAEPARATMLSLLGAVSATVVLVALLIVTATVVQALRQRSHELALLRAVGATPRQVRTAVGREAVRIAVVAAATGAVGAYPAWWGLRALLAARGALPEGLELPLPAPVWPTPLIAVALTVVVAYTAALTGCAATVRVSPARAPHENTPGKPRWIAGLALLGIGVSSAGTATTQAGDAAAAAAGAAAVTMVIACALLGPWIARGAMRVLAAPLRRFGGPAGHLAAAGCTARAASFGAAITPIVLVTAFVGVQLSGAATMTRAADSQAHQALRAGLAVSVVGGLPDGALARVREVSGVGAATAVVPGTVVLARREAGSPELRRLPVLGITPQGRTGALAPGDGEGTLRALRPGTVAVGADRARSLDVRPGSRVTLRFGDGTETRPRVVATYRRSLALGDFLLPRADLLHHASTPAADRILIVPAPHTDRSGLIEALKAAVPGALVDGDPGPPLADAEDRAPNEVLTAAAVGAIGGFTVIAVLSTLSLIMIGRAPELRLLRLAGAGRRQLRRMLGFEAAATALTGLVVGAAVASVPLLAFSVATAGSMPCLPSTQCALIVGVVAVTAWTGTLWPVRRTLRGRWPGNER
ncbi:FtsX-like permease family protein [Streptomyces tsukubensis]|uniref:ABC transporter permease n=1 Tax=Streptomyces tsukubensis TaxID=83656 RepID=A0A1V4A4T5_9ACTN|nr:FtsX-like permease family protein [Streptomyces tsukubensis]OON75590.1 ABC transporter permease [Streptomyces tsukubensis]QFR94430.1 FtsX-like permease family protein [Streptomyces tsukubensis]